MTDPSKQNDKIHITARQCGKTSLEFTWDEMHQMASKFPSHFIIPADLKLQTRDECSTTFVAEMNHILDPVVEKWKGNSDGSIITIVPSFHLENSTSSKYLEFKIAKMRTNPERSWNSLKPLIVFDSFSEFVIDDISEVEQSLTTEKSTPHTKKKKVALWKQQQTTFGRTFGKKVVR